MLIASYIARVTNDIAFTLNTKHSCQCARSHSIKW